MDSYELAQRLTEVVMPSGRIRDWARVATSADDDLKLELINALEGSGEFRKQVIAAASSEGTGKETVLGVGGYLRQKSANYVRFVLAVSDVAINTKTTEYGDRLSTKKVVAALQKSFEWTASVFDDPLEEEALLFAKASLVSLAANGNPFLHVVREEIAYLTDHYDALEPYLTFIIQSRDMSRSQLNMLLTTKPLIPLIEGQL